ncbi:hypothetical protein H696_03388 [Fonticula alba]|uniref:SGS domain-containing protein n=1 Tax=Fonticula alba TaxID=691883 RepID=A0A058Z7M9_FONAL|nr:hypothetical protein H696_03388 [Fonticula alba]KCV69923.1 hypothetical protein H696_03388 [Fonticula alba]|eukprot:XP_009495529.1 hypothetical protein H696_03388 [Fonticula alba]
MARPRPQGAVSISSELNSGSTLSYEFGSLFQAIKPAESTFAVFSTKIELKLAKALAGLRWAELEGTDPEQGAPSVAAVAAPAEPPAPRLRQPTDWSRLEREIEEEEKNFTPSGDQALNKLFQDIYSKADPDTRRAMMKSYVESNGTALSTNWGEVGSKRVPVTPPTGMVAKKYDS